MVARFKHPPSSPDHDEGRRSVLVTGASGRIGTRFAEETHQRYRLSLLTHPEESGDFSDLEKFGSVLQGRLQDIETLKRACRGMDTVLHLAANPSPSATWASVSEDNITGTYNLLAAARAAGCRRVVFASSVHAVSAYPAGRQVHTEDPVSPGDLYGVSKCFGEAMGRYMAEREGLSFIAIRIGWFQSRETLKRREHGEGLSLWISPRDLVQLVCRCIDDQALRFGIFHGVSDNRFRRLDIADARELLGYAPEDDAFSESPHIQDWALPEPESETGALPRSESGLREDL